MEFARSKRPGSGQNTGVYPLEGEVARLKGEYADRKDQSDDQYIDQRSGHTRQVPGWKLDKRRSISTPGSSGGERTLAAWGCF